jgi:hypothetical protein
MTIERRQKVKDLIELAVDKSTSGEERGNAAMRAVRIIRKYNLLSRPTDGILKGNKIAQAMETILEKSRDPDLMDSLKAIKDGIESARRSVSRRSRR